MTGERIVALCGRPGTINFQLRVEFDMLEVSEVQLRLARTLAEH